MKLRHTLFFRLLILFVTMFSASLLITLLVYIPSGENFITDIKMREMQPILRSMSSLVQDYHNGLIDQIAMDRIIVSQSMANKSQLLISDMNGNIIYATKPIIRGTVKPQIGNPSSMINYAGVVSDQMKELLLNQEVSKMVKFEGMSFESLFVGQPIVINGRMVGAVAMILPAYEITSTLTSLTWILVFSMTIVLLIMTIPIYFLSKRFTKPINQMVQTAIGMKNGDFTIRADEKDKGEIGELGKSLNELSTELSQTINDVSIERNRLMQMMQSMSEGIVSINNQHEIIMANPAVFQLFELVPTAQSIQSILDMPEIAQHFDQGLQDVESDFLLALNQQKFKVSIRPIRDEANLTVGSVGIFQDVTEAERLEQMRKDYVANVSHELRTPLTAIKGLLDPLNDGLITSDEKKQSYYALLLKETARLNRLINDLLELSRLQSGNTGFEPAKIDLNRFISELHEKYLRIAKDNHVRFEIEPLQSTSYYMGNEDRLDQVLTILLDNAFKFTPEDGTITVTLKESEKMYKLEITDTGDGISPSDLPYIFDRFYIADKARTSKSTGLGLSIAKEILQHMNETISVRSVPGKGTTFTITLSKNI
ncbi:MAG: ATP-binding protein [Erysipelotrichaceae bacterium]